MTKALLWMFVLVSCGRPEEKPKPTSPEPSIGEDAVVQDAVVLEKESLMQFIDFTPGTPIKIDSPKRFIQIFILFTLAQYEVAQGASQELSDDESVSLKLEENRNRFYANLGISEEEYIEYGKKNGERIASFLADNPDFQRAYTLAQEQGTEF